VTSLLLAHSLVELSFKVIGLSQDLFELNFQSVVFLFAGAESVHLAEAGVEFLDDLGHVHDSLDELGTSDLGHVSDSVELSSGVIELLSDVDQSIVALFESGVLFKDVMVLLLQLVELVLQMFTLLLKAVDDTVVFGDGDLQLRASLLQVAVFLHELVVLVFEVVILLLPFVDGVKVDLDLLFEVVAFVLELKETSVLVFEGVVLLLEIVEMILSSLELISGLLELVLSGLVFVMVHVLELFELSDLDSKSLDLNVEISVLLLVIENLLFEADDLLIEFIFLFDMHFAGSVKLGNSHLEFLGHSGNNHATITAGGR